MRIPRWFIPLPAICLALFSERASAEPSYGLNAVGYTINEIPPVQSGDLYPVCHSETENNINRNFEGEPFGNCPPDLFMVHYTGFITVPENETIKFMVAADDGGTVKIGATEFGTWNDKGCTWSAETSEQFVAGSYALDGWFYENGGATCFMLAWNIDEAGWEIVPDSAFTTNGVSTTTTSTSTTSTTTASTTTLPETTTSASTTTLPTSTTTTSEPVQTSTTTSVADTTTTTTTTTSTTVPQTTTTTEAPYTPPQTTTTTPTIETQPAPTTTEPSKSDDEPADNEPEPEEETGTTDTSTADPSDADPNNSEEVVDLPDDEPSSISTETTLATTTPTTSQPETTEEQTEITSSDQNNSEAGEVDDSFDLDQTKDVEEILETLSLDADLPVTDAKIEEVLALIETATPEQITAVVTAILNADVTNDQIAAVASNPAILEVITEDQAEELFESLEVGSLTDEQIAIFGEAIQSAPQKIKKQFEQAINIFGSDFESYVPVGSNIPVSERRVLVAVGALLSTSSVAPISSGPRARRG